MPQLCGPRAPCQAAQELLQSLLGSISCHTLDVKYPGSAKFLLGVEGQHLLHGLEAQFQCVFGTEHLASAILDIDPERVRWVLSFFSHPRPRHPLCCDSIIVFPQMDPTEALQVLHGHSTDSDEDNMRLGRASQGPWDVLWCLLDHPLPAPPCHLFSDPFVVYSAPTDTIFMFYSFQLISPLARPDP